MAGVTAKGVKVTFHAEEQDTECAGWRRILQLIDEAAADGRTEFAPRRDMTDDEWVQLVTLPPSVAKLKSVKRLMLYGSHLVRIPPEIGEMSALEEFVPYTSSRLHWFPYEITRCTNLKESTVSTRCLYGNYKYRPPFPRLAPDRVSTNGLMLDRLLPQTWGCDSAESCSVCGQPLNESGLHQVWISLRVATDVLPLLVNACSEVCIRNLPAPPQNYVTAPHKGGRDLKQPPATY